MRSWGWGLHDGISALVRRGRETRPPYSSRYERSEVLMWCWSLGIFTLPKPTTVSTWRNDTPLAFRGCPLPCLTLEIPCILGGHLWKQLLSLLPEMFFYSLSQEHMQLRMEQFHFPVLFSSLVLAPKETQTNQIWYHKPSCQPKMSWLFLPGCSEKSSLVWMVGEVQNGCLENVIYLPNECEGTNRKGTLHFLPLTL